MRRSILILLLLTVIGPPSLTPQMLVSVQKVSSGSAIGYPLAGLLVGGVTGGLVGYATCAPCNYELEGLAPIFGTVLGGAVGVVAGLVIGLQPRDSWEEVPLGRMRISFAPRRDGFSLGVSLAY